MNPLLPYIVLPAEPTTGAEAAERFDASVFEKHPSLNAFCRAVIEGEFIDAPAPMRYALAAPLQGPFLFVVEVTRGSGSLFEHQRQPVQVRAIGFDPSRDGVLRDGIVTNTSTDREPEPQKSPGELSHLLYSPREVT